MLGVVTGLAGECFTVRKCVTQYTALLLCWRLFLQAAWQCWVWWLA